MEDKSSTERVHHINFNEDKTLRIYSERKVLFEEDNSIKKGIITFYFIVKSSVELEAIKIEKELPVVGMKTIFMYHSGVENDYGISEFNRKYKNHVYHVGELKELYDDLDMDLIKLSHTILGFIGKNIEYSLEELEAFKKI